MPPKRFVFRLETVLKVKLQLEEDAKRKYGALVQALMQAEAVLVQIRQQEADHQSDFKKKLAVGKGIEPAELQRYQIWTKKLEADRKKQIIVIEDFKVRVEEARVELIEAMKERKIIETLKEQQLEAFNKEMDEEEAKMIDELATLKYARDAGKNEED